MVSNSTPVVLVADSGGVADFVRFGIEFLHEQGARDENVLYSDKEYELVLQALEKIDSQKIVEWLHKTEIRTKNSDETKIWEQNLLLILSQQDLIEVFYHKNKEKKLEHSILGSLINNLPPDDLVQQIQLCMQLNQIDLARERIRSK
jgi:hypothetical protein